MTVAVDFLAAIDMHRNQIYNLVLPILATDPSPTEALIYYNSVSKTIRYYNGTGWIDLATGGSVAKATNTSFGIVELSVAAADPATPIVVGTNDPRVSTSGVTAGSYTVASITVDQYGRITAAANGTYPDATSAQKGLVQLTNDLGGTATAPTVVSVGGASAANIADAVSKRHSQNTDTGTTATSFQIDSGNNGPRIGNNGGVLEVKNAAGNALGDIRANNIYVNGSIDEISSTQTNIADQYNLYNAGVTANAQNSDGGIKVKRLATDNSTRVDAGIVYSESAGRLQATSQHPTNATSTVTRKVVEEVQISFSGDGSTSNFNSLSPHNLNNPYATAELYDVTNKTRVFADVTNTDANNCQVQFAVAPANGVQYILVVRG